MFDGPSDPPGELYRAVMALLGIVIAILLLAFPALLIASLFT